MNALARAPSHPAPAPDGPEAALQQRLAVVRERFLLALDDRLDRLEMLRDAMDIPAQREAAMREAGAIVHKVSGSAKMLGFDQLGLMAGDCEARIIDHLETGDPATGPQVLDAVDGFLEEGAQVSNAGH